MSLKILVNSAWENATRLIATDTSNVTTSEDETIENIAGGMPYVFWQSSSTSDRRIVYIDKSSNLSSTHFILLRADRHVGHKINLRKFTSYPSTSSLVTSSNNPIATADLIGQSNQDLVLDCSASSVEALCAEFVAGTGGNYTKYIHQAYFANAFTLNYPGNIDTILAPFPSYYKYKAKSYLIDATISIAANKLTRDEVNDFENLYNLRQEPFFIYDSTGDNIRYKLIHCVLEDYQIEQFQDDFYNIALRVARLRRWS